MPPKRTAEKNVKLDSMTLALVALLCGELPDFREHTVATDLKGGYQVTIADVNGDGKPDLIALASGMTDLVWFENPTWTRHVMAKGLSRMINLAVAKTGADVIPQIVVAHEFNNDASKSIGIVSLLTHDGDPAKPWKVREIDRLTTSHRIRVIKLDGKMVFVNAPLTGAKARPPEYRDQVPLVLYRPGEWKRELISDKDQGVVHGLWIGRLDSSERADAIFTASFTGVHRYRREGKGWQMDKLVDGDPAQWPKSGSSEVTVGHLGPKETFIAAIEPWHGNQVVVYRRAAARAPWTRRVIEEQLEDGHTLVTADLDGDGKSEIIAGYRGPGRSVYMYQLGPAGWKRTILDKGGIAAASCAVGDLNGDGRPDIACIGSATSNLKWYENLGRHSDSGGR